MTVLGVRHHVIGLPTNAKDFKRGAGRAANGAHVPEANPDLLEVNGRRLARRLVEVLLEIARVT